MATAGGVWSPTLTNLPNPEAPPPAPMLDEYGCLDSDGETAVLDSYTLESGKVLKQVDVRYKTWGERNEADDNVLVICHALTGNADAGSWWSDLFGKGKPLDTNKYFIFCSNILGGCYGTTGPSSINPETGKRYGSDFPRITLRDMVGVQAACLLSLGIRKVRCVIGGSMGGMQALELAVDGRGLEIGAVISLCSSGRHQAWQIGISECQRQAIQADPAFMDGNYSPDAPPTQGLSVARMMAMLTYRTHPAYATKFGRACTRTHDDLVFDVESYLQYQGKKFNERDFDANSYIALSRALDSHDLERGRADYLTVLRGVTMPAMIVSISSDVLYPVSEQLELADNMPNSQHHMIQSDEGHDGFLLEHRKVGTLLRGFLMQLD